MARFNKLQTLNYINENKIVPVFYNSDIDISINVMKRFIRVELKFLNLQIGATLRGKFLMSLRNIVENIYRI